LVFRGKNGSRCDPESLQGFRCGILNGESADLANQTEAGYHSGILCGILSGYLCDADRSLTTGGGEQGLLGIGQ
jgi:hypothetical protein